MRFLNTIKKARVEDEERKARVADHKPGDAAAGNGTHVAAPFGGGRDLKIGRPVRPVSAETMSDTNVVEVTDLGRDESTTPQIVEVGKPTPKTDFAEFTVDADSVNKRIVAISNPNSPYCEDFRSLRTQVLHQFEKADKRSLVMLSVGPAEGKSIAAANLAWLLAQTDGVTALLIDGDMRLPSLATYLGFESRKGLSDVLANEASLESSIVRLRPSGMCVLPGGSKRDDVAELSSGPKLKKLIEEARQMFDYVIIDAPPLNLFSDAAVMLNNSDAGLLVIGTDQVGNSEVERVLASLPREKVIGSILNRSEEAMESKSYYDRNYYYQKGGYPR